MLPKYYHHQVEFLSNTNELCGLLIGGPDLKLLGGSVVWPPSCVGV